IDGTKHSTWFGAGIDDTEPVSLFHVTHINRGDHRVRDARSDWFPMPAAVRASKETGTRSSAVHARRVAGIDRDTNGRSSVQVCGDGPGGGAPSNQQGRSSYDYDADHDSISFCLWFSVVRFIRELHGQKLTGWHQVRVSAPWDRPRKAPR